ncbi:hypothetical protein HKX48_002779, partial [Thoreauomyces humboldtii]
TFLTTIVNTTGGTAYIADPYGGLVATSSGEPTAVVAASGYAVQVAAAASKDPFTTYTAPRTLNQTASSGITTGNAPYWYMYQQFQDQPNKATFRGTVVAGREATYYTAAVTLMLAQFDSFLHQAIRNSALITVAFILAGFASIVFFVYHFLLIPLNAVKGSMVKATKFDFSDMKNKTETSDASFLSEINALQYVFRAMIISFANALQKNKSLQRAPLSPGPRPPTPSSSLAPDT